MNILNLVIEEIKCSYKMIVLGVAIAMAIMSVVIVFYNLTDSIMPAISNEYDEDLQGGVSAYIQRLKVDDIEILTELGAKDIVLNCAGSNQFYMSSLKINDKNIEITDKDFRWFTEEEFENIPEEIAWEEFNYSESAIIYCSESDMNKFNIDDILSLYLKNGTLVETFKVEAIVQDERYDTPFAILPSAAVIKEMDKSGVRISCDFNCTILKASQYMEFKKTIESNGAYCSSAFDNMLGLVSTLKVIFLILANVFIIISVFVIVTTAIININTREKFLVLQKVLGATDYKIISIYIIILEIQILVADLLGCILGIRFTNHLTSVVYELYKMEYSIKNTNYLWMFIVSILISNIAMLPFVLVIKKVINSKDVVSIINNKE